MIDLYSKAINNLLHDVVDEKLKLSIENNKEIVEQKNLMEEYDHELKDLFDRLDEKDRSVIDNYLSLNNFLNSVMFCDMYREGIYDGILLLKHFKVI
ncbi:hypothetical protein [Vallitalea maricola]|uniref:hypothetical protein n=1 Tax=Vallitalea maricola TaxID=3074433 RepID=UPI0030D7FAA3